MKNKELKKILKRSLMVVVCALLYATAIKLIVQPNKFLAGGVSGVTILVSRAISIVISKETMESILYSIFYAIFNLPIFIFGFKRIGKKFILFSIANVALVSLFVSIIPASLFETLQFNTLDLLTSSILAGLLTGISCALAYANSFSNGGTDIIAMYLARNKGKGIGTCNFFMNASILVVGGIVFKDFDTLVYTVIYFFINSLVVNNLYIGQKKVLLEIVTTEAEKLSEELMKVSHHGCTIVDVVGAYSHTNRKMLRLVVYSNQTRMIGDIVKRIDPGSFTTIMEVKRVNGNFYLPPLN